MAKRQDNYLLWVELALAMIIYIMSVVFIAATQAAFAPKIIAMLVLMFLIIMTLSALHVGSLTERFDSQKKKRRRKK